MAFSVKECMEIVKQEAEKYNNGWIPCSEKLPDVRQDVLVTVKYTGFMGMHGYWIKTGHMEAENDWWGDCAGGEVIAWQPLLKPFQKGVTMRTVDKTKKSNIKCEHCIAFDRKSKVN